MRVLVADDDLLVRHTLGVLLSEAGCDVAEAADGQAVIDLLSAGLPDALVLDLLMPRRTGYEVLKWLSAHDPERHVRVLILSAFVVDADGFDRHPHVHCVLQKPLMLDQFLRALEDCRQGLAPAC